MLDFFAILSRGGIVLWYFQTIEVNYTKALGSLVNEAIIKKTDVSPYIVDKMTLHYKNDNELDLILVAAHQNVFVINYIKDLLMEVNVLLRSRYQKSVPIVSFVSQGFDSEFLDILRTLERSSNKSKIIQHPSHTEINSIEQKNQENILDIEPSKDAFRNENQQIPLMLQTEKNDLVLSQEKKQPFKKKEKSNGKGNEKKKQVKEARKWTRTWSKDEEVLLDYSLDKNGCEPSIQTVLQKENAKPTAGSPIRRKKEEEKKTSQTSFSSRFFNLLSSVGSGKILDSNSLKVPLEKVKEHLCAKNVALEVAEKIIHSLHLRLEGKTLGTFQGVTSCVMECMEETVRTILVPQKPIDLYREILTHQEYSKSHSDSISPYVVVFCGVNGVGKSTNLSKIAYWLLSRGLRVSIAACDTFRSGAVEQLKTHVCRLSNEFPATTESRSNVQLFEKGYGKDVAGVACEAIKDAKKLGFDVMLVDTAGRMQDNEPLMKSLSKLIKVNNPNLVVFVGEALVGNDGVDQLQKFNDSLAKFSQGPDPAHLIDAIVLTKFDTIDDKVGAALSMTYITRKPILFVGIGQTYKDLIPLDVESVVKPLMS